VILYLHRGFGTMSSERGVGRKRGAEDAQKDYILCPACIEVEIESPGVGFELDCEQKCTICAVCFSKAASAALGDATTIKCPRCESNCCCWTVNYTHVSLLSGGGVHKAQRKYTTTPSKRQEIDSTLDPVRFHQQMGRNHEDEAVGNKVRDRFIGLTLTTSKDGVVQSTSEMCCTECETTDMGENQIHLIEKIQQIFHVLLITKDKKRYEQYFYPGGDPCHVETLQQLAKEDYTVLHRAIHVLAYGELLKDLEFDKSKRWSSLGIMTWAVTDVMQCLRTLHPGLIKSTIGTLLKAHTAESGIYMFLKKIGISQSYVTVKRKVKLDYAEKLEKGIDFGLTRHDYVGNFLDNCGYHIKGSNCGYMQTILMFWLITRPVRLRTKCVYDTDDGTQALSRERVRDFSVEREKPEVNFETLAAPKDWDYVNGGIPLLTLLNDQLKLRSEGKMFTVEIVRQCLENNTAVWPSATVPNLFGKRVISTDDRDSFVRIADVEKDSNDDADPVERDSNSSGVESDEEHSVERETILEANDAHVEVPMMADLSKDSVLEKIVVYTGMLQSRIW